MARLVVLVLSLVLLGGSAAASPSSPSQDRRRVTVTYDELPLGPRTTLPCWQRGRLHLGDTVISTERSALVSRGGTTIVARGEPRYFDRAANWFLVDGTRRLKLPMLSPAERPLMSANGRWLAWLEVRAPDTQAYRRIERYRVVVYDVQRRHVANRFRDRRLVAWEDGLNGIRLHTLSNRGRLVLLQGRDGDRVLSPRGEHVAFAGPHIGYGPDADGWPGGTTVVRGAAPTSTYGTVAQDGTFEPAGSFTVAFSGVWSGDGSHYAFTDYDSVPDPTFHVRSLDGTSVQLDAPTDLPWLWIVGWESPDAVILWHHDDYSSQPTSLLVRCFASTGACERVPGGPRPGIPASMPSR